MANTFTAQDLADFYQQVADTIIEMARIDNLFAEFASKRLA